ncbi:hypothetical protein DHX103_14015 [Planococcus sp. X10-3]|uniref:hypothetical protein n=1 Tax=Planococcus sp. X10-3 TaxID=3061240 RepID=UPI003BB0303C
MKGSLGQILYGYLFIFLAIRVGVDILADPIGYFLIAAGCYKLGEEFNDGKTAAYISIALIFFSVPSVFIDFNLVESGPWYYYSNFLFTGELVLTFYLFRLLKQLAERNGEQGLAQRTQRLFNIYIPANLLMLGLSAFLAVFAAENLQILAFVLVIILLILNITFLILLSAFRKALKDDKPEMISIEELEKGS